MKHTAVSIAILAGGQSLRMRTNKSFVTFKGKPIFDHVVARVTPLNLPITLITNSPEAYANYALPMIADVLTDQGALGGLYTAILSSETEYVLCVACDMPLLNSALLQSLVERRGGWDAIVPRVGGFPEALHAVYGKSCLDAIQANLLRGELKASGFYDQVKTLYVEEAEIRQYDPDLHSFMNVNTPDDLAQLETLE